MSKALESALLESSETIAQYLDAVFQSLDELRRAASPLLASSMVKHDSLDELEPLVRSIIEQHDGLVISAGVAVAPGVLVDAPAWMQSWHWTGSKLGFTRHDLNPDSINFYDYIDMAWFKTPAEQGRPVVAGPYMDFGATDARIITASMPTASRNSTVSVVAADLSLERLEYLLLTSLGPLEPAIALLSKTGKVIATNSAKVAVTGELPKPWQFTVLIPTTAIDSSWRLIAAD
ncbi:hypothetical protein GCM10022261_00500 [Brevibacterium daeguense]|uniref:Cache domain-containing protein n=1 Tax=Brevibacterium daeguense TaxID=909936 RepID=A0ABP8EEW1_9MICO|nr:cache domain-containing protein [Brevibacterium daeguense]